MQKDISSFKGYVLNDQFFKTKGDVREKIQGILYSYTVGTQVNSDDDAFLRALLKGHPDSIRKAGLGIESFEVRRHPRFTNTRCFYLIRVDGSEDDFSFMKCLYAPTPLAVFKSICRKLVGWQLYWIKSNHFRKHARGDGYTQCPITGYWITQDHAHVDHIPPDTFEKIVTDFIARNNIHVESVEIKEAEGERQSGKTFASDSLAEDWISYHEVSANLRIVSSYANLCIIRRKESALYRLFQQTDLAETYELEPIKLEFLIDLALTCNDPRWRKDDFGSLKSFAGRIVGPDADCPQLRTVRHEEVLLAFLDWLLPEEDK